MVEQSESGARQGGVRTSTPRFLVLPELRNGQDDWSGWAVVSYPEPSAILYISGETLYRGAESPMNKHIITCINWCEKWVMASRSTARPSGMQARSHRQKQKSTKFPIEQAYFGGFSKNRSARGAAISHPHYRR